MKRLLCVLMTTLALQTGFAMAEGHLQQPSDYAALKSTQQLIDVRTPAEFSEGTLDNAQNIDFLADDFRANIQTLNKNEPVYLFCRSGNRSEKSRNILLEEGFSEVYDLEGGYKAWTLWQEMNKEKTL